MSNVFTPEFRVSYPNVFKAKLNEMNGKEEFSLVALFPKNADLSKLKAAAQEAIEKKWGKDKSKWPSTLKSPFRDQGERKKYVEDKEILPAGYEEGCVFITLRSTNRPGVVDSSVQPILNENDFYAGCWARATVVPYAYEIKGNKGVSFGLQNIQKTKDGEPLSGRMKAEDEFAPIATAGSSPKSATDLF